MYFPPKSLKMRCLPSCCSQTSTLRHNVTITHCGKSARAHTALSLPMRSVCAAVVGRSLPPAAMAPGRVKSTLDEIKGFQVSFSGWGRGGVPYIAIEEGVQQLQKNRDDTYFRDCIHQQLERGGKIRGEVLERCGLPCDRGRADQAHCNPRCISPQCYIFSMWEYKTRRATKRRRERQYCSKQLTSGCR